MKLCIFNGSPRGKKSNTSILLQHFCNGFIETEGNSFDLHYLNRTKDRDTFLQAFHHSEYIFLAFPLYTDAMPGVVKEFIDSLKDSGTFEGKNIFFLIQSGFPESYHSTFVGRYLEKLTQRLHMSHMGTIIRGGVEGIQMMPPKWTAKVTESFYRMGQEFGRSGVLSQEEINFLGKPYKLSSFRRGIFKFFSLFGLTNYYWNVHLKKNDAYEKRFDAPYGEKA